MNLKTPGSFWWASSAERMNFGSTEYFPALLPRMAYKAIRGFLHLRHNKVRKTPCASCLVNAKKGERFCEKGFLLLFLLEK
jgi:hypothetical protein